MERKFAKEDTPIERRLKRPSNEPPGSKPGISADIESTDAENVNDSISAGSPISSTIPPGLQELPSFIQILLEQDDELVQLAAARMDALARGNAFGQQQLQKRIAAQVDFNRLRWVVEVALGRSKVSRTDVPLELLAAWLDAYDGKKVNLADFHESVPAQWSLFPEV